MSNDPFEEVVWNLEKYRDPISFQVHPTQSPESCIEVKVSKELILDLKAIVGLDPVEELRNIVQGEADWIYNAELDL